MKRKVTKEPKISLCRACHGTGTVEKTVYRKAEHFGLRRRPEYVLEQCPQCEGSGRVLVSAEIDMNIEPYNPGKKEA